MCGDGQFLVAIKKRKLAENVSESDASNSIYGIDLTQENVDSAKARTASPNIICADSLGDTYSNLESSHYRFDGSHPYDDETKTQTQRIPR